MSEPEAEKAAQGEAKGADPLPSATACRQCRLPIPSGARLCSECNSYQDWRGYLNISGTVLALLVALLSVATTAVPIIAQAFHTRRPNLVLSEPVVAHGKVKVIVTNLGDAPAAIRGAALDNYEKGMFLFLYQGDSEDTEINFIEPGSRTLLYHIVPADAMNTLTTKKITGEVPYFSLVFSPANPGGESRITAAVHRSDLDDAMRHLKSACSGEKGYQPLTKDDLLEGQCGYFQGSAPGG